MKTLFATAALSLLTLSTIAEAQNGKNQTEVATQLVASLPTQDFEIYTTASYVHVNGAALVASLPIVDENVQTSITWANAQALVASLPTVDENVEMPTLRNVGNLVAALPTVDENVEIPSLNSINPKALVASLPTVDENVETPALKVNMTKWMAALPISDEHIQTSVVVDTYIKATDLKNHSVSTRLTEE